MILTKATKSKLFKVRMNLQPMQFFKTVISGFPIPIFFPSSKFVLPTLHQIFRNYIIFT